MTDRATELPLRCALVEDIYPLPEKCGFVKDHPIHAEGGKEFRHSFVESRSTETQLRLTSQPVEPKPPAQPFTKCPNCGNKGRIKPAKCCGWEVCGKCRRLPCND